MNIGVWKWHSFKITKYCLALSSLQSTTSHVISYNLGTILRSSQTRCSPPHFTGEETKTQKGGGAHPRSHHKWHNLQGLTPGLGLFPKAASDHLALGGSQQGRLAASGRVVPRNRKATEGEWEGAADTRGRPTWAATRLWLSPQGQHSGDIRPPTPFLSLDVHGPLPQTQLPPESRLTPSIRVFLHVYKNEQQRLKAGDPQAEFSPHVWLI